MIILPLFATDGLEQEQALAYRQKSNNKRYTNKYLWILVSIYWNSEDNKGEIEMNPTLVGHRIKPRSKNWARRKL